jgi:hypothetical protein
MKDYMNTNNDATKSVKFTAAAAQATTVTPQKSPNDETTPMDVDKDTQVSDSSPTYSQAAQNSAEQQIRKVAAKIVRKNQARVLVKIFVKAKDDQPPSSILVERLRELYAMFYKEDRSTVLAPWRLNSTAKLVAVPHHFPTEYRDLLEYVDNTYIRNEKDNWVKMRFLTNGNTDMLTSMHSSPCAWWFNSQHPKAGSYYCTVQNSDKAVEVCYFLYSGQFSNTARYEQVIKDEMKIMLRTQDEPRIGCRTRKLPQMDRPEQTQSSRTYQTHMNPEMAVVLEADKEDIPKVLAYIKKRFQDVSLPIERRPGMYRVRALPVAGLVKVGSQGAFDRVSMIHKHRAIAASRTLISTNEILSLDTPMLECGQKPITLREIIMTMQHPAIPQNDETPYPLFDAVDFSLSPNEQGLVLAVAANNRLDAARNTLAILPDYVAQFYGPEFAKKWFTPIAIADSEDNPVTFVRDNEGNWTGEFSTGADQMNQRVLNERMGYQFEGLEIMQDPTTRTILSEADASVKSFAGAFGGGASIGTINSNNSNTSSNSVQSADEEPPPVLAPAAANDEEVATQDPTESISEKNPAQPPSAAHKVPPATDDDDEDDDDDSMELSQAAHGFEGGSFDE